MYILHIPRMLRALLTGTFVF